MAPGPRPELYSRDNGAPLATDNDFFHEIERLHRLQQISEVVGGGGSTSVIVIAVIVIVAIATCVLSYVLYRKCRSTSMMVSLEDQQ